MGVAECPFWCPFGLVFGAIWCLKVSLSHRLRGPHQTVFGQIYVLIALISLSLYGGEGGIRTPDSLATMPDFESGAFNRALPPLRAFTSHLSFRFKSARNSCVVP